MIVIGAVVLVVICALVLLVERLTRPDADDLRHLAEAGTPEAEAGGAEATGEREDNTDIAMG